jgi:hypothetical protein
MARLKWPIDWLVGRGYLVDDGPDRLAYDEPTQHQAKYGEEYLALTLTPILP